MVQHQLFRPHNKLLHCLAVLVMILIGISLSAQADASLSGSYAMIFGVLSDFSVQQNMFNQQVGFCPLQSPQLPFGYSCNQVSGQDFLTATLLANGKGAIESGSYTITSDPNAYQCSSKYNEVPATCPYTVPAGVMWNSSTSYVVGDEVDSEVGGELLTYQAVKNSTGTPPGGSACTQSFPPPECTWDQLYASATGNNSSGTGSLNGTYSVASTGSGTMQLTLASSTGDISASFAMVVPPSPVAGQAVPLVGMPTLGNEIIGSGGAVREK
jgi:hypothetical protein